MLTLNPDAALQAAITKSRRRGESLEDLLARLLIRDVRRLAAARKLQLRSLHRKIEFSEANIKREQVAIARYRREVLELQGHEPDARTETTTRQRPINRAASPPIQPGETRHD